MKITLVSLLAVAPLLAPPAPPEPLKLVMPRTVPEIVVDAAQRNGVRPELALKIAWRESRYLPDVVNPKSGASGLFQLKPRFFPEVADFFDAEENADVATKYIAELIDRYGEEIGLCLYGHRRESCLPQ
jgi:soluble lytic murein transglycosylase-like protein